MSILVLALTTALQLSEPRVVIHHQPALGLGRTEGTSRRDPSEILRIGELDYVFYTRSERGDLHYPRSYTGRIWYATSADEGHTWLERGVSLEHGAEETFDAYGVFDPSVVRNDSGAILLYYAAIGPGFNFRFETAAKVNPMYIGVARLHFESGGLLARSRRLTDVPALGPSPKELRSFDALRVRDPAVLVRDGLYHLYYQGYPFPEENDRTSTGLAVSSTPEGPFVRAESGTPALAFSKETFIWPFRYGVLSLVTHAERGLYWAVDGMHFARVLERVEGVLNDPGIARPEQGREQRQLWGLHVGRYLPDPFLERFELELVGEIAPPPATILPVANATGDAAAAGWAARSDWLEQHTDILRIAKKRPKDVVFLGDSFTQGWGGRGREVQAPGAEAFARHFGAMSTGNYGISTDGTQHVLWRIDHGEFARGRSKVIVLQIGANNIGHDTPQQIATGVFEILTRLRQALPRGEVLLLGIPPRASSPTEVEVRETNALLADFDRLPRVTFMDVSSLCAADLSEAQRYENLAGALHLPVAKLMLPPHLR